MAIKLEVGGRGDCKALMAWPLVEEFFYAEHFTCVVLSSLVMSSLVYISCSCLVWSGLIRKFDHSIDFKIAHFL